MLLATELVQPCIFKVKEEQERFSLRRGRFPRPQFRRLCSVFADPQRPHAGARAEKQPVFVRVSVMIVLSSACLYCFHYSLNYVKRSTKIKKLGNWAIGHNSFQPNLQRRIFDSRTDCCQKFPPINLGTQ